MTLREALQQAAESLSRNHIDDARLEAEILLRHALGLTRAQFYARLTDEVPPDRFDAFQKMAQRRLRREPSPYIVGRKEFFGLDFLVDRRVLIPRPETELLVAKAIEFAQRRFTGSCLIADVGTGSGAIAVSLAVHLPQATIYGMDSSADALEVARKNCLYHKVQTRVKLLLSDTVSSLPQLVHIMVANLPYVKDDDLPALAPEIRFWEPMQALAGGSHGLDRIGAFLAEAGSRIRPDGAIMVEMHPEQKDALVELAKRHFPKAAVQVESDLAGLERIVTVDLGQAP